MRGMEINAEELKPLVLTEEVVFLDGDVVRRAKPGTPLSDLFPDGLYVGPTVVDGKVGIEITALPAEPYSTNSNPPETQG